MSNEPGMRYNISMINALVMYVGTQVSKPVQEAQGLIEIFTELITNPPLPLRPSADVHNLPTGRGPALISSAAI